jgi:cytochrome c
MLRTLKRLVLTGGLAWASVVAAATPSQQEVIDLVNKTVAHAQKVGVQQAASDVNSQPTWKVKGMNTVMFNFDGLNLASAINPRIVGKMMIETKDPTGKQFIKEYIATAKSSKGEGWVDFQFMDPDTNKVADRTMFVRRVPGQDALVGVAVSK